MPVGFELPPDQPVTTLGNTNEDIKWESALPTKMHGVDYRAIFSLPGSAAADATPADKAG